MKPTITVSGTLDAPIISVVQPTPDPVTYSPQDIQNEIDNINNLIAIHTNIINNCQTQLSYWTGIQTASQSQIAQLLPSVQATPAIVAPSLPQ